MSFEDELPDTQRVEDSISELLDNLDNVTEQELIEMVNMILLAREYLS